MRHSQHFVDELSQRNEVSVGRMLSLSSIEPDPDQPRSMIGDLGDLVASIRSKGVLEPILVRRLSDEDRDGRDGAEEDGAIYRIISGERRYRASLQAGLLEIPAIEMEVTEQEALEIALIENLQRKDLTAFEEAEGYRALADQYGYTHEQIAEAVGKSRVVVTESFALLQMPERVREAVQALDVHSKSILLEVLKADDEDEMIRLLERVSTLGLNRRELREEVKQRREAAEKADGAPAARRKPPRRKPYTFRFRAPDKRYSLSLSFKQSEVDPSDLIRALESVIEELKGLDEEERQRILAG
ncbi:MAG: ParB/RepB/Spo0J family partition protein [Acidobacteria bacterium]|nr:MAG: ParB/RepB/Spo0J family partition protein [Acidobacteriota bacterium]REK10372.1 MAG: ParB/RepB/Spo0J family partition protein [Acidobacteriota bacterium]